MWATKLASSISRVLPDGWFASPTVHWDIEVDVAALREPADSQVLVGAGAAPHEYPEPSRTIPFGLATDVVEVQVFRDVGELTLVGVVEFVGPANKDRRESREAFVTKCEAFLRDGIGLVIVDVVSNRTANLHTELLARLDEPPEDNASLYVSGYRPFTSVDGPTLSLWYRTLEIGTELPPMTLFLKDGPAVELALNQTYLETCIDQKIPSS